MPIYFEFALSITFARDIFSIRCQDIYRNPCIRLITGFNQNSEIDFFYIRRPIIIKIGPTNIIVNLSFSISRNDCPENIIRQIKKFQTKNPVLLKRFSSGWRREIGVGFF